MDVREKLVEIVKRAANLCLPSNTKDFHLDMFVTNLIAHDVTVQEWIPTSERLPEHGEVVLCYMSFKDARALQWDNVSQCWLGYGRGDDWSKAKVTHWMPLPQPPKEE